MAYYILTRPFEEYIPSLHFISPQTSGMIRRGPLLTSNRIVLMLYFWFRKQHYEAKIRRNHQIARGMSEVPLKSRLHAAVNKIKNMKAHHTKHRHTHVLPDDPENELYRLYVKNPRRDSSLTSMDSFDQMYTNEMPHGAKYPHDNIDPIYQHIVHAANRSSSLALNRPIADSASTETAADRNSFSNMPSARGSGHGERNSFGSDSAGSSKPPKLIISRQISRRHSALAVSLLMAANQAKALEAEQSGSEGYSDKSSVCSISGDENKCLVPSNIKYCQKYSSIYQHQQMAIEEENPETACVMDKDVKVANVEQVKDIAKEGSQREDTVDDEVMVDISPEEKRDNTETIDATRRATGVESTTSSVPGQSKHDRKNRKRLETRLQLRAEAFGIAAPILADPSPPLTVTVDESSVELSVIDVANISDEILPTLPIDILRVFYNDLVTGLKREMRLQQQLQDTSNQMKLLTATAAISCRDMSSKRKANILDQESQRDDSAKSTTDVIPEPYQHRIGVRSGFSAKESY